MRLTFINMLIIMILITGCKEEPVYNQDKFVISGTIVDESNNSPLKNAQIIVRRNTNPGFFNVPRFTYLDSAVSDIDGKFLFYLENLNYVSLLIKMPGEFIVDNHNYPKYSESYYNIEDYNHEDILVQLIPHGVLKVTFQTDLPLQEEESLFIQICLEGTTYSYRNQVPETRNFLCQGNHISEINWKIKRIGKDLVNKHDILLISSFSCTTYNLVY